MDNLAAQLSALVPPFKRNVAGTVNGRLAECLAFYWFVSLAGGVLTPKSVDALIGALGTSIVGASWSDWGAARQREFFAEFQQLCGLMQFGKQAAFAMGAGRATEEEKQMLYYMNVAKAVIAKQNMDDTDPTLVEPLMGHLSALRDAAFPLASAYRGR